MSDQPTDQYRTYPTYPQMPPQAPVPPKASKLKRFGLPVGLLLAGLLIGGVSGASAVPEPVEIVKEVEVEKIVTKTVKETPGSCIAAIQYGEEVIQSSARVAGIFGEILTAVRKMDAAAITALNPEIDAETSALEVLKPKYQSARDQCRSSK